MLISIFQAAIVAKNDNMSSVSFPDVSIIQLIKHQVCKY